jgi:outer membrane protein OmpA-like peptidoglycan-associated protein
VDRLKQGCKLAFSLGFVLFSIAACGGHRLDPKSLPRAVDGLPALPSWYPEKPWTASQGQSRVYIEGKVVFDSDRSVLRPGSEKVLNMLLKFLSEHPEVTRMRVEGHTDDRASDEHNLELSAKRSLAVCDWLVEHGIANVRLIAVGFGKQKPIAPNELVEGRSENRRTEFHVAEIDGRLFLNKDPTGGGYVLDVLSLEERKQRAEKSAEPRRAPPQKAFRPTGDEVREVAPAPASTERVVPAATTSGKAGGQ